MPACVGLMRFGYEIVRYIYTCTLLMSWFWGRELDTIHFAMTVGREWDTIHFAMSVKFLGGETSAPPIRKNETERTAIAMCSYTFFCFLANV